MDKRIIVAGFGQKPKEDSKDNIEDISRATTINEIDTLNDVTDKLSRETISFQEFEIKLRKELLNVKDLQKNLETIKIQIKSAENILNTRQNIFERLITERNKRFNMNIEQCKTFMRTIGRLDDELKSNIDRIISELRLLIRDEKSYFDIDTNVRNTITNISQEAQMLESKVILMGRHHTSANDILSQIYADVSNIEKERQSRKLGS
jgi:hypothetical protein